MAGCGDDDAEQTRTTAFKPSELTRPGDSGRLEVEPNNSSSTTPIPRAGRQIKGVGDDSAYGGAGAWWTRTTRQLVAYDHDKMVKVRVNVRGFGTTRRERRRSGSRSGRSASCGAPSWPAGVRRLSVQAVQRASNRR